jgi:hypothetical protein
LRHSATPSGAPNNWREINKSTSHEKQLLAAEMRMAQTSGGDRRTKFENRSLLRFFPAVEYNGERHQN